MEGESLLCVLSELNFRDVAAASSLYVNLSSLELYSFSNLPTKSVFSKMPNYRFKNRGIKQNKYTSRVLIS